MSQSTADPQTIAELLSVKALSPTTSVSNFNPMPMGSLQVRAYGGCTLGVAISAAYATGIPKNFHPYSITGQFLGPAAIDRPLYCEVERFRDTRTFITMQIRVHQLQDNNKGKRICLNMVLDFQAAEPHTVMEFSIKPGRNWAPPSEAMTWMEHARKAVDNGFIPEKVLNRGAAGFNLAQRYFDCRHVPDSIMGIRLYGIAKNATTEQDELDLTDRLSADWCKVAHEIKGPEENIPALACLLDMAMSFVPLTHIGKFLDDVGACGSLDFALRLFSNDIDLNKIKLRELRAMAGSEGRSYNEARLFDENGKLVAIMNQQGIMRPKEVKSKV